MRLDFLDVKMAECSLCNSTGLVEMRHKENKAHYCFRCPCNRGNYAKHAHYPEWSGKHSELYEPLIITQDVGGLLKGRFGVEKKKEPDQKLEEDDCPF